MVSSGRAAAIAIVASGLGFVGGAWFIGSGFGFQVVPVPPIPAGPVPPPPVKAASSGPPPVGLPQPASFSGGSANLWPKADRTDLMPSPGCSWFVEPRPFRVSRSRIAEGSGWLIHDSERWVGGYPSFDPVVGSLRYLLVQATRKGFSPLALRPVLLDEAGNRMVPWRGGVSSSSGGDGHFSMSEFHFEALYYFAMANVAFFGIERVVPDADRLLEEAAQGEALETGIPILPAPRPGEPYAFHLPGVDGRPIRSGDFRGRPIVVIAWGPDGFNLSMLVTARKLREAYKEDELAIVNVSFHGSAKEAKQLSASSGPGGPLVVIPNDSTVRRLWRDGSGLAQLPGCFLVDREGILRFVGRNPFELKDEVDILLGRAVKPFSMMIHPTRTATKGTPKSPNDPAKPNGPKVRPGGGR